MKKKYILFLSFIILFLCNNILWASPINENVIKYRYYIKTLSSMPEFKDDLTLMFENYASKIFLENEVKKTSENYEEILNIIDCKNTDEIVMYDEYLQILRDNLASKCIFPIKFNNIHINQDYIFEKIFNEFSFSFIKNSQYTENLPDNVKKTKRIFPYLYAKYNITHNKKSQLAIFKSFLEEDNSNEMENEYQKAVLHMDKAYSEYINDSYSASYNEFEVCLGHWQKYWKLAKYDTESVNVLSGSITNLQGSSALEAGLEDAAQKTFLASIEYFKLTQNNQNLIDTTYYLISDIYYRKQNYYEFVNYLNNHLSSKQLNNNKIFDNAIGLNTIKQAVLMNEYFRISQKYGIWTLQNSSTVNFHKYINDAISRIENNCINDNEGNYIKKTLKRYKEIMSKNKVEIKSISFYEEDSNYVKLKDHITDKDIIAPEWTQIEATLNNHTTYILQNYPVAIERDLPVIMKVNFINLESSSGYEIIGEIPEYNLVFKKIYAEPSNPQLLTFQSSKSLSDKIGVFNCNINWYMQKTRKDIIDKFYIGKTNHKIYSTRMESAKKKKQIESVYWQIMEYSCNWLKDLSIQDIQNDDKIVDSIWEGCSNESLTALGYKYKYPKEDDEPLNKLLVKKQGACGVWGEFFIQCIRSQNVNPNLLKKIWFNALRLPENNLPYFKFYKQYVPIGGIPPIGSFPYSFGEHVVVGYKGISQNENYKGYIYDPSFHIKCYNTTTEYEDMVVEQIEASNDSSKWRNKIKGIKEFKLN